MTQHWGDRYFHFLAECLPRITLMLDILLAYPDIKVPKPYQSALLWTRSSLEPVPLPSSCVRCPPFRGGIMRS